MGAVEDVHTVPSDPRVKPYGDRRLSTIHATLPPWDRRTPVAILMKT
jgi:hypothetical protein